MNTCPCCQAVNPESYQFCQFCGSNLSVNLSANFSETVSPKSSISTFQLSEGTVNFSEEGLEPVFPEAFTASYPDFSPDSSETLLDKEEGNLVITFSPTCSRDIEYAGKTDVGMQRDRNEDDFATVFQTRCISGSNQISDRSDRGLFILCDGMGGHDGGEIASTSVVNSIIEQFRPFWIDTLPGKKKLHEIICQANTEIFLKNESEQRESLGRMGTTLALLAIHDSDVVIAHVGDSRIYKISVGADSVPVIAQLTRDHEVLNQLLDLGLDLETVLARPNVHQLTQAIGPYSSTRLEPTISCFEIAEPSLFLICSDGLSDNDLIEDNWRSHLLPILNREIDLPTGLDNLIELGNSVNGHDNLTAILVLCDYK